MKKYLLLLCILYSNVSLAETPLESLPGAPDNVQLEILTPFKGKLTWIDTAMNEVRIKIWSGAKSAALQTLKPNAQHAYVTLTPGQSTTFTVCAESTRGVACSDPLEAINPQTKGSIRGRLLDSNFRPVANKTFQLNGMTKTQYEQELNFEYSAPYVRKLSIQIEVPDHLLLDPLQSQPTLITTSITPENPGCIINGHAVFQNGIQLLWQANTFIRSHLDTAGLWTFTFVGTDKCLKAKFEARFQSYMAPTVGQFTTDEDGYYEVTDIPLSGAYKVDETGNSMTCVSALEGRDYIGIIKNTRNANFICRKL